MSWLQLQIAATRETADALESALLDAGAAAVTLQDEEDQPIYEPGIGERPIWQRTRVTGLFSADTDMPTITARLRNSLGEMPLHRIEILEDRDWVREWMDRYQPIRFGDNLWICPSWCEPSDKNATNLMLDPGLAFGTGTHPTTALCMQWLDSAVDKIKGATVVDYGCGSGILGLAALLLGAKQLIAIDNDPQALIATEENARRNGVHDERLICALPDDAPDLQDADIMIANILASPLISLAPRLGGMVRPGAQIVLSGVLEEQAETVWQAYSAQFSQCEITSQEQWVRINAIRR